MARKPVRKKTAKRSKASAADAELILNLYDLRREEKLREARSFLAQDFWPASADEMMQIIKAAGTDENRYFRQALTYWDMAASLVAHGALNADLFFASSGEMYLFYAKCKAFLAKVRNDTGNPYFLQYIEEICESTPQGRERVSRFEQRVQAMLKMRKAAEK